MTRAKCCKRCGAPAGAIPEEAVHLCRRCAVELLREHAPDVADEYRGGA